MAKEVITKITCDICGRSDAISHSFLYDRRMDAAGSMENVSYDVDLCTIHFDALVGLFGHPSGYRSRYQGREKAREYGRKVMTWIDAEIGVWRRMTPDERKLAISIEG
jgi:hypothetical protein